MIKAFKRSTAVLSLALVIALAITPCLICFLANNDVAAANESNSRPEGSIQLVTKTYKEDQILSSKAEERRNIFEEASGITKYKYRKAESEKKLLQTEDNLTRIRDLLSELESQVGPLEVQSKKARKYLVLYKFYTDIV